MIVYLSTLAYAYTRSFIHSIIVNDRDGSRIRSEEGGILNEEKKRILMKRLIMR